MGTGSGVQGHYILKVHLELPYHSRMAMLLPVLLFKVMLFILYKIEDFNSSFLTLVQCAAYFREILCCEFNPEHYLFACGTKGGTVECWDPRDRSRVAVLDITKNRLIDHLG